MSPATRRPASPPPYPQPKQGAQATAGPSSLGKATAGPQGPQGAPGVSATHAKPLPAYPHTPRTIRSGFIMLSGAIMPPTPNTKYQIPVAGSGNWPTHPQVRRYLGPQPLDLPAGTNVGALLARVPGPRVPAEALLPGIHPTAPNRPQLTLNWLLLSSRVVAVDGPLCRWCNMPRVQQKDKTNICSARVCRALPKERTDGRLSRCLANHQGAITATKRKPLTFFFVAPSSLKHGI